MFVTLIICDIMIENISRRVTHGNSLSLIHISFDFKLNEVIEDDRTPRQALTEEQEERLLSFCLLYTSRCV